MRFRKSLPTRGAWIEISVSTMSFPYQSVAPHAGSVDRNERYYGIDGVAYVVAPHAGSVDRNNATNATGGSQPHVAPHAGSVDRNNAIVGECVPHISRSPRGERG